MTEGAYVYVYGLKTNRKIAFLVFSIYVSFCAL